MLRTIAHRLALGLSTTGRIRDWWVAAVLLGAYGLVAVPFGLATGILRIAVQATSAPRFLAFCLVALVAPSLAEESIFRAALLPHPTENMPFGRRAVATSAGLASFVLWHPLNAWLFLPTARPVFWDGRFLALAGLLGACCTGLYQRSGSVWPGVAFHWMVVVAWKAIFGGGGYGFAQFA
jgi:predicted Abi (CAAX) family protease